MKLLKCAMIFLLTLSAVSLQGSTTIVDLDLFLQPLRMTSAGLHIFFEQLYNSKRYTEDFFPNNIACHMCQFLDHGKKTSQTRDFLKATFSLFSQKLKGCLYVSAYAFTDFLIELPGLVDHHFEQSVINDEGKKSAVKEILYQEFLNNFNTFKENPSEFLDSLSDQIVHKIDTDSNQATSVEALRQTIVRFIELCISKLLWDATDKDMWKNVQLISSSITALAERKIINDADDLNDIAWSLTHRLSYFMDIVGTELPLPFYEQARDGLQENQLFMLEEQEDLIEKKSQHLERIIIDNIAKKHAQHYGIVA